MILDQTVIDAMSEAECVAEIKAVKRRHRNAARDSVRAEEQDSSRRLKAHLNALRNPSSIPYVPTQAEIDAQNRQALLREKLQTSDLTLSELNEIVRGGGLI